ncbi:mechanosensitive ion channel family protein [Herpetosiphon sp. NSE202]|uniref:mechanosensitive ion channel family protein n=1 Tax=Herpetosiphon sp. NSE202 TaxID=3351349 RepID=UPI0036417D6F
MDWNLWGQQAQEFAIRVLPRVLAAIVILLTLRYGIRLANGATNRVLKRVELPSEAESLILRLVRILVIVAGLVIVLLVMGWGQLALSFVAGLGVSGLIIGFALQDITKNLAAGILLLFQRPFRVGDRILIGNDEGTVTDIAVRATTMRTADGREVMVPNATIYTGTITNLTRYVQRRHSVELTLKRDVDFAPILQALTEIARTTEHVLEKPAAEVLITAVKADGLIVETRFWLPSKGVDSNLVRSNLAGRLRAKALAEDWLA